MRILVVNDDGIDAEGLRYLLDFAKNLGEVTVAAPMVQQSGKSQGIELHKPYKVKMVELEGAVAAYAVDSTPADCVRFAILGLKEKYDLVFSGVNKGYNIGDDIAYSGTVGAVYEASRQHVKAIAFSTDWKTFGNIEEQIPLAYDYITKHELLRDVEILNVNFPTEHNGGIRITHQGYPMYEDEFVLVGEDLYEPRLRCLYRDTDDLDIDTDCVMNGYISITPLRRGNTDEVAYAEMKKLNR